ncbi:unnamed protein product [Mytilus coruscus]|uniref:WSC domain-containing protein n=1 Tax=Mytilus coruscus TaxID=42192 RepID=A0A6J8B0A2_MYTCO|nr:unnamed protein product [Mytilus coruscus]
MNIQPHNSVRIALLLFLWKCKQGCYSIPLACKSLEIHEKSAKHSELCQLKCMDRQYFGFNQNNERCVCFDDQSQIPGITFWVGVYRQRLYIDNSDIAVLKAFNQIQPHISHCNHLSSNADLVTTRNCSSINHYKCSTDLPDASTSRSTTILINETDIIVGIVISVFVIILAIVMILVFMYRRKYSKEQLSLDTARRKDCNTIELDNDIVFSDYQQLDDVNDEENKTKAYDQLHVTCIVDTDSTNDQSNASFSKEEYSKYELIEDSNEIDDNTATSEYEQLNNATKDTSMKAFDQLHVTHVVNTDPTYFYSKTMIPMEEHIKYEPVEEDTAMDKNTITSEYEQLDNNETDKSVNMYDHLNT